MEEFKWKKKKSIIFVLIMVLLLSNIIPVISSAYELNYEGYYTVKQIKSEADLKKDSATDYIIVFQYENGGDAYALASEGESSWDFGMKKNNAEFVTVNDEEKRVYYNGQRHILWNFNNSKNTVDSGNVNTVISSSEQVFWVNPDHANIRQLEFGDMSWTVPSGIKYVEHASGMELYFQEDGTVKIKQLNNSENNWLGFYTDENRWTATRDYWAMNVKLYEVIRQYTQKSNFQPAGITNIPEYPNPGSVKIDKTCNIDNDFEKNGIVNIKLTTTAQKIEKDMDVVIVFDDSNSTYANIEGTEKRRIDAIKEMALNLSKKVLDKNPNNRVGIVRYANNIVFYQENRNMGMTNDINAITDFINLERPDRNSGTDYTRALYEANNLLEAYSINQNKDTAVIFITDGIPSMYNRTNYNIYMNTTDGVVGNHADNWVNYVLNNDLKEMELMKQSGVAVYSINTQSNDISLSNNGSSVITPEDTTNLLNKLTPGKVFTYNLVSEEKNLLDDIYNEVEKAFYFNPSDSKVTEVIKKDFVLQNKTIAERVPEIVVRKSDREIEKITFSSDGTKAYSSLKGKNNILTYDDNNKIVISAENFKYTEDGQKITWNIDELFLDEYSLEYPVYLMNTVNAYNDGTNRQLGVYDITEYAVLEYTNYLNQVVKKDFPKVSVKWKTYQMANNGGQSEPQGTQIINENGNTVKTGDNIILQIIVLIILVTILIIYIIKNNGVKNGRKK